MWFLKIIIKNCNNNSLTCKFQILPVLIFDVGEVKVISMNSKFGKTKTDTKIKASNFKNDLSFTMPGASPTLNVSILSEKISEIISQEFPMLKNGNLLCDLSTILTVQRFCTVQSSRNELSCNKSGNYRFQ